MISRALAPAILFAAIPIGASAKPAPAPMRIVADAGPATPSDPVLRVTGWVINAQDNGGLPFIIVDKVAATVFAFDAGGTLVGSAPVLIGIGKGDDSAPGVGDKALSRIPVSQRTTPAGRYFAKYGFASRNEQVLWIDYANAVSLHPVITSNAKEHRLQRLRSPSPDDNRITYGCINVPKSFYAGVIRPLFKPKGGVAYILPESRPLEQVFAAASIQRGQVGVPVSP